MKTVYIQNLNNSIRRATLEINEAQAELAKIQDHLKTTRRTGTKKHAAAVEKEAHLQETIQDAKKRIANAQRLKRNPEVIRRNRICDYVEKLAKNYLDVEGATSVDCYVNDTNNGEVSAQTDNVKNWNYYAKSFRFPKIEHYVELTVNKNWDTQVRDKGLAVLGGLLTLQAKPAHKARYRKALKLAEEKGVELFEATWARKGKGYQVYSETGFIAIRRTSLGFIPSTAYHDTDPLAAVRGSHRKFRNIHDLPLEVRDVPEDAVATWDDTRAVGACEPGVKNWCEVVGIDSTLDSVPLIEVVRGYYQKPAPEARAIILRVLRRYPRRAEAA